MPVYNADEYLTDAIESILNQTYDNFEFLIICDDPSERTLSILNTFIGTDPRIKTTYQKKQGLVNSLNTGIRLAKGEYIARMDADDISHPQRLEKQVEFLEKNSDIGLCGTWANLIDKNGDIIEYFKPSSSPELIQWDLHFFCAMAHPSVMIRKSFFERNGLYLEADIHCEDYALWVRAINNTKMSNIPLYLVDLRQHDLNVSKCYSDIQRKHGIAVSRIAIVSTLKNNISEGIVNIIHRRPGNSSTGEYITSTNVLRQLQRKYLDNPALSHKDKRYIKKSMCVTLYSIAILPVHNNPILSFYIFMLAFINEPFFFIKRSVHIILKRIQLKKE